MAGLTHAPQCCVTMAGMLPSLDLSVLKWGRGSRARGREEAGKCGLRRRRFRWERLTV